MSGVRSVSGVSHVSCDGRVGHDVTLGLHQIFFLLKGVMSERKENWLVDWYQAPEDGTPKALHYTEGGPWFENYRHCSYHDVWKKFLTDMMYSK